MPDLQRQYRDIDQKAGEICTAQLILQPTIPKSDRLLDAIASRDKAGLVNLKTTSPIRHLRARGDGEFFYPSFLQILAIRMEN